jgi:hypothetical protein
MSCRWCSCQGSKGTSSVAPRHNAHLGLVVQSTGLYSFTSSGSPVSATTVLMDLSASSWLAAVAADSGPCCFSSR